MPPLIHPTRDIVRQEFTTSLLAVGTVATPLSQSLTLQSRITSFAISVPTTAANSIFLGDGGVTITNGFEIPAGSSPVFLIENYKQPYELQGPLLGIQGMVESCEPEAGAIPFACWDPSQVYLIAAAATNVSIIFFKEMFI